MRQKINLSSGTGNGGLKDKKVANVSSDLNSSLLLQSKTLSSESSRVDTKKSTEDGSNKLNPGFPRDLTRLLSPSGELDQKEHINTDGIDEVTATISSITKSKSLNGSPKVNEITSLSGVLRYALHLRFMCPFPKKYSRTAQKCKFDPLSEPALKNKNFEGERRFYLYNDMRVVFPQRHSDADEGKVCYKSFTIFEVNIYAILYNRNFFPYINFSYVLDKSFILFCNNSEDKRVK